MTFNTTTGTDEESYLQFDLSESCGGNNASFDADRCAYVLQRIEMTLDLGNINETFDLNFEVVETIDTNEVAAAVVETRIRVMRSVDDDAGVVYLRPHKAYPSTVFRVHQHTLILRVLS